MSLRETVNAISRRQIGSIAPGFYRSRTALSEVVERLGTLEDSVLQPQPTLADVVARRVAQCMVTRNCSALGRRDWRVVPWIMWQKPNAADDDWFLDTLFALIVSNRPLSVIKALTHAYVANFNAERRSCRRVAQFLRAEGFAANTSFGTKWLALDRQFSIFDPDVAANRIGSYVATCPNMRDALRDAGIPLERIDDSLARQSFNFAVRAVAERIRATPSAAETRHAIEQLFNWNTGDAQMVRYTESTTAMATTLLETLGAPAIAKELGEPIIQYFVRALSDPRLNRSRWNRVSPKALDIAMALLVKTTLEDFFRVIDATALGRMWLERKEFWLGYWRKGAIEHAWVAFGPKATLRAGALGRRYGSLNGVAEKTHSALILRIGDLTLEEMSHNGRCLLFPDPRAPRPGNYDLSYNFTEMRDQCSAYGNALTHMGDWRPRFASAIYECTGIRHPSYGAGY